MFNKTLDKIISSGLTLLTAGIIGYSGIKDARCETIEIPLNIQHARPLRMVRISAGSFYMGSSLDEIGGNTNEKPSHLVTFENSFFISETEITQAQWLNVVGSFPNEGPSINYGYGDNIPIYFVEHNDITSPNGFIGKLSQSTNKNFRLPSEAEWEYACRGGTQSRFFFGESFAAYECSNDFAEILGGSLSQYMKYCGNNSDNKANEVAKFLPNQFGLYDMSGNIFEWVEDYWHPNYDGAPNDGSAWGYSGDSYRVRRGGSYINFANDCRSALRSSGYNSNGRSYAIGFRIALDGDEYPTPSPTFSPTPTDTNTFTPTYTHTDTFTPTITPTFSDSATSYPTYTFYPTYTPYDTNTPYPTYTNFPDLPTLTPYPTYTFYPTNTEFPTSTQTLTYSPSNTLTFTSTPTLSLTNTLYPTYTFYPTNTPYDTNTPYPTYTYYNTPTQIWNERDLNNDGKINEKDLLLLIYDWKKTIDRD